MSRRKWLLWVLLMAGAAGVGEILSALFHQPWWYGPWMVLLTRVGVPVLGRLIERRGQPWATSAWSDDHG